jgi:hypothetical protein
MANAPVSRLFQGPAPQTVRVNTTFPPTGTQIGVRYDTPNGNQPNSFGNALWIWQTGNQVPWASPGESTPIPGNTPSGDHVFTGLDVTNLSYLIGYSVGPKGDSNWLYPNVVATVFIPALGGSNTGSEEAQQGEVFSPNVSMYSFGSNYITAKFDMLAGFNPEKAKTYVGIWEGQVASYTQAPQWSGPAIGSNSSGYISITNIKVLRGTTYTIGLFASGYDSNPSNLKQTALAATSTFTV